MRLALPWRYSSGIEHKPNSRERNRNALSCIVVQELMERL